jgi:hypothetical protein
MSSLGARILPTWADAVDATASEAATTFNNMEHILMDRRDNDCKRSERVMMLSTGFSRAGEDGA